MMTTNIMTAANNDADLVGETLSGNRDAFGRIVSRYQSLICSLAYSATGSLGQSEDLAQETFITAWKHLGHLRERDKLRAWLCGIARNRINNFLRREGREPVREAASLEEISESHSPEPLPVEHTISREEEQILWRSLERIPEIYREPLVLFYREHQSIEAVAEKLELTEDNVKQRLSRGRKLLQEEVLAFVEGALARTNPGKVFTLGVLAALPALTISAKAATIGAAAKGGAAVAKGVMAGSLSGFFLGPMLGVLLGYLSFRETRKNPGTPREHKSRMRFAKIIFSAALVFGMAMVLLNVLSDRLWHRHPAIMIALGLATVVGWCVFIFLATWHFQREQTRLREEELALHPEFFSDKSKSFTWPLVVGEVFEYRSHATLFGLPLVHCRFGRLAGQKTKPAVGWIAYGEKAYGILFASGGVAVGAISMGGGASIGIIAFGGISFGLLAFGGLALGGVALGGAAIGLVASGGIALGWHAALGGMAVAREFALGGGALAHHINDDAAREFYTRHYWLNVFWHPRTACAFWLLCFGPTFLQMMAWRWWRNKMLKRAKENLSQTI